MNFFIWNNGRLVINVEHITMIEVLTEFGSSSTFARIHVLDTNSQNISHEAYIALMEIIAKHRAE